MHKEQMIKKEKKEQDAIRAEEEQKIKAAVEEGEPTGKRRAAEKYALNINVVTRLHDTAPAKKKENIQI